MSCVKPFLNARPFISLNKKKVNISLVMTTDSLIQINCCKLKTVKAAAS